MIKKLLHSGNIEAIAQNYDYKHTISKLETSKDKYIVGVDIATPYDYDKSVIVWNLENDDGSLTLSGSRIVCENGECIIYRGMNGGCPVCFDPCF